MKFITTRQEFKKYRKQLEDKEIGLVPTMGNLHEGHLTLIEKSISKSDLTIVSIFVNPLQFGQGEDFNEYPRTIEEDLEKIKSLHGSESVLVFAPKDKEDIFPDGFSSNISVQTLQHNLCATSRPGHFDGVTTVVYTLFNFIKPTTAYFGQKDYQQFRIIEKMVHDLDLEISLNLCPIIRDNDGLALSSRNQYLTEEQRHLALELPETLSLMEKLIRNQGLTEAIAKAKAIANQSEEFDYLEILDAKTLQEADIDSHNFLIAGAYKAGTTRLIDNILL